MTQVQQSPAQASATFSLTDLSGQEVQIIANALIEQPFKLVVGLMKKLQDQVMVQEMAASQANQAPAATDLQKIEPEAPAV